MIALDINSFDILRNVDEFYKSAWDKLVLFGSGAIILVGIVLPYLANLIIKIKQQKRELTMRGKLLDKIQKFEDEIIESIDKKFKKDAEDIRIQIENVRSRSFALSYHLQGIFRFEKGEYRNALASHIWAGLLYVGCSDQEGIKLVLDNIIRCLPNVYYDDLTELKEIENISLGRLISLIENNDTMKVFTSSIVEIKKTTKGLKKNKGDAV
jgi:hypothetical protein